MQEPNSYIPVIPMLIYFYLEEACRDGNKHYLSGRQREYVSLRLNDTGRTKVYEAPTISSFVQFLPETCYILGHVQKAVLLTYLWSTKLVKAKNLHCSLQRAERLKMPKMIIIVSLTPVLTSAWRHRRRSFQAYQVSLQKWSGMESAWKRRESIVSECGVVVSNTTSCRYASVLRVLPLCLSLYKFQELSRQLAIAVKREQPKIGVSLSCWYTASTVARPLRCLPAAHHGNWIASCIQAKLQWISEEQDPQS